MSELLGIWSLGDASEVQRFSDRFGPVMVRALTATPQCLHHIRQGPLWLLTSAANVSQSSDVCVACVGYLPAAVSRQALLQRLSLSQLGDGVAEDGLFSLIRADFTAASLELLRSHSGGERLYYYVWESSLILFSNSIRPLISVLPGSAALNRHKLTDIVYSGMPLFDDTTLLDGIREVLPGHRYRFKGGEVQRRWCGADLLRVPRGDPQTLALEFKQALSDAMVRSMGAQRPVAVTLSGGIDSAAIAALAVEAYGADNVVAYTYEFADAHHPVETPYAVEVVKKLGIKRHRVFQVTLEQYLQAIPETVWRCEHFAHWSKAFMLPVAKRIRDDGFHQFLSGFGVGSHMGFLQELTPVCDGPLTAALPWLARLWRYGQQVRTNRLSRLEYIHPLFGIPNRRLYYLLITLLQAKKMLPGDGFLAYLPQLPPPNVQDLQAVLPHTATMTDILRYHCISHLVSCVDVTRWEKPMRELGIHRVSPAHFPSCLPYAYLPLETKPFVWSQERRLRPGKWLLQLALQDCLPESVLYRKKSWADAVVSARWLAAGIRWMRQVSSYPPFPELPIDADSLAQWDQYAPQAAISALAFWRRIFVELPVSNTAPEWQQLRGTTNTHTAPARKTRAVITCTE